MIVVQGGAFGGWSLCAVDGRPRYCHNLAGLRRFVVKGSTPIPVGLHQVRMEFTVDGTGLGRGARVDLYLAGSRRAGGWRRPYR